MFHPSFKDIFKSSLDDACISYKYKMSPELERYLIKMCVEDLLTTSAKKPTGLLDSFIFIGDLPKNQEVLSYLKFNGDYHLTIAGYVPEAFCNKHVDFNYYISLGQYSYYRLHQLIPKDSLYKNIAFDYMQVVLILNEVFDTIRLHTDAHMLEIWEAYKETGHPIFRKKLIRLGMDPKDIAC